MTSRLYSILQAVDYEAGEYHKNSREIEYQDTTLRLVLNAKYTVRLVTLIESAVEIVADPIDEDERSRAKVLIAYIKGRLEGVREVEEIMHLTANLKRESED